MLSRVLVGAKCHDCDSSWGCGRTRPDRAGRLIGDLAENCTVPLSYGIVLVG